MRGSGEMSLKGLLECDCANGAAFRQLRRQRLHGICFGTIKTELEKTEYPDSRQARADIAGYLAYYNHEQRHSALDYLPPAVFEGQLPPGNERTRLAEIFRAPL